MKIATWNVNSIGVRLPHLLGYLAREDAPDIVCLQELKCIKEQFPFDAIAEAGYKSVVVGQKAYNGVAILSRTASATNFETFSDVHTDARFLRCDFQVKGSTVSVICLYVPNGQDVGAEKFFYKLEWLKTLDAYLRTLNVENGRVVVLGDFNIAPDDRDSFNPAQTRGRLHCSLQEREALNRLTSPHFVDVFRLKQKANGHFSWWDYREGSFQANKGLRIDLIYASPAMAERCSSVRIVKEERSRERPSDHAPVEADFEI